jgi:leucyl aminopeptidase (aminopeptidase T)
MSLKTIQMIRYAKIPYELNAKQADNILIIADTNTDPLVWQAFASAAYNLKAEPTVALITPRQAHYYNPPEPVVEAMKKADINHFLTSTGMVHSPAAHDAGKLDRKNIASEQLTADMLTKGAATADYDEVERISNKMKDVWTKGSKVRVTSELGTDITAYKEGRPGYIAAGKVLKQEGIEMYACAFPDGEAGHAPIEGTTEGVFVVDVTAHYVGALREPMRWTIKKGRVIEIQGGVEARRFLDYIKTYGDENAFNVGEIAVGANPKAIVTGVIREDKKIYGTVHVGLGMNTDVGGKNDSKLHLDGVIRRPTVYVDDKIIVENGVIKLD